jgi:hypothetical protein
MREFLRKVGAGLLTLALLGSVGRFLAKSLVVSQPKSVTEVTEMHASAPAIETVTVVGHRLTTTAKVVEHKRTT